MNFIQNPRLNRDNLNQKHQVLLSIIYKIYKTPTGKNLLERLADNETITGVIEGINGAGRYSTGTNIAVFEIKNGIYDWDQYKIGNEENLHAEILNTLLEELCHAEQSRRDVLFPEKNLKLYRLDAKVWDLAMETHAKLQAVMIMVELAIQGDPRPFLVYACAHPNDKMLQNVHQTYLKHGQETIRKNPALLFGAFRAGMSQIGDGYYHQASDVIDVHLTCENKMDINDFYEAFGQLPGCEGNMLRDVTEGKVTCAEDLAWMVHSRSVLTKWLHEAMIAKATSKPEPKLTKFAQDLQKPKEALTQQAASASIPQLAAP